ncbi:MAG TPA: LamG-like jellyroll fold domain-containing protein [Sedimentisphaerales bacterium]|nr:LamG-like jellyroll fold domain-containing protein [Sedimentisphaerales bacterium]
MYKKAVFLVCCILMVLALASSVRAATWSGAVSTDWCTAGNWSPAVVPGAADTVYIYSAKPVPLVSGSACPGDIDANVGWMNGPATGGGTQAMDIIDATFIVQNTWYGSESTGGPNSTVNISGSSVVQVLNLGSGFAWRGHDYGRFNLNILSTGSGDPNVYVNGTLASADDPPGYFVLTIDNGRLTTVGGLSWGDDGGGELHVSGARTELHLGDMRFGLRSPAATMLFNMSGGLIDMAGAWSMGGENDGLHTTPWAIQMNFDAGKIICNDFSMRIESDWPDGIPFNIDFEQNAVLEIKQDRLTRMQRWIELGYITGKGGTEAPTAANIGGHTFVGFDIYQKEASNPFPANGAGGICPTGVTLTWKAGDKADQHKIFFGTSYAVVDGMVTPTATKPRGDETYNTGSLAYGMSYYWRVDEVNNTEPNTWRGPIWDFSTPSGMAGNPTPGDGQRGVAPGTVVLSWDTPCYLVGQTLSYGTTYPQDGTWTQVALGPGVSSYPITAEVFKNYYWRVDTDSGSGTITGSDWDFRTGYGGLLMYYKFDGTIGNDLPSPPSPITDDSGNGIEFKKYVSGGYVKYAASGHDGVLGSTASADFQPSAGLYRLDPCGPSEATPDLLRLDGSEYTVELWHKAESWTDLGTIWILYKHGSWGLAINSLPGCGSGYCDNSYRWQSGGSWTALTDDNTVADLGEWVHIAVVRDQFGDLGGIYLNGVKQDFGDGGGSGGQNPPDNNSPVWIGAGGLPDGSFRDGFFDGQIDEVRIHDIALGPCAFLINESDPEMPICPTPADGEQDVDPCGIILSWTPGESATSHRVYLSTDIGDVENLDPSVKRYDGPNTTVALVDDLDNGTTYYWRVVEVTGGGPWEGQVWSFTTTYVLVDLNLRLWYEFDETWGDTAHDHSGRGFHADGADDQWDPDGKWGGCLFFDDDISLEPSSEVFATLTSKITVAVWLNATAGWGGPQVVFDTGWESSGYRVQAVVPDSSGNVIWRAGNDSNDLMIWRDARPSAWAGDWHHFAFVKDESANTMSIYFDGLLADTQSGTIDTLANNIYMSRPFRIGAYGWHEEDYEGRMDDFLVYDRVLTDTEIAALYRGGDLEIAWGPSPYDGQPDAVPDANLTWLPGDHASQHKVFFGTARSGVEDMTDPCAIKGLGDESYDPGPLELDTYYYWRIDEVNGPNTWTGPVWRFKVADFVTLDDFEQYDTDQKAIQYTWYDQYSQESGQATGSWLELAQAPRKPVHGGEQAMSYTYDTDDPWADYYYAEAWLPLQEIGGFQDWTSADVRLLTLFFYGQAGNDATEAERMYVGIDDTWWTYAEMRYGDNEGEALSDLLVEEWQRWDIPFVYFGDSNFAAVADDVDFSSIRNVYIGFGNRRDPVAAGKGVVYFDDIRLNMPVCKPEYGPWGDLSGDCLVGVADIGVIADQWLLGDVDLKPVVDPGAGNLVGHWELEGNADDSSVYANHGTAEGAYTWVTGHVGSGAIELNGGRVVVPDAPELRPSAEISAAAWVNYSQATSYSARVVVKGLDEGGNENFAMQLDGSTPSFFVRDVNRGLHEVDGDDISQGEWAHVAGTYDGSTVKCYVNGQLSGSEGIGLITLLQDANDLAIGNRPDADDRAFRGTVDDVRVYNRALTRDEVAYLASGGDGILEMVSPANLYSGESPEVINFRDFAKVFDNWGAEQLWPPPPAP